MSDAGADRRVAVVLVEYHSGGLVAQRASWAIAAGYDVVVADNSGTYEGPGTTVSTGGNLGYGTACNMAVERLPGSVGTVVLMNPDAEIAERDLAAMVESVRSGAWQMLAPLTLTATVPSTGFRLPDPWREIAVTLRERQRLGASRPDPVASERLGPDAVERTVGPPFRAPGRFGSGALTVIDRVTFGEVGGFDERYFLYVEDADLWERSERHGAAVGFDPAALLVHRSGTGSPASRASRAVLRRLGVELYLQDRGQKTGMVRRAHRACFPARQDDPLTQIVAESYRAGEPAAVISAAVKAAARRIG